jgi:hypothetical protein
MKILNQIILFIKYINNRCLILIGIYRDYLFKKSLPEIITDLYMKFYKRDIEFVKNFGMFIYFSCRISKKISINLYIKRRSQSFLLD